MVQCARVIQSSDEVCGGHVHTIDRLLTPPPGDLLLTLSKEHKKFAELIAFADMAVELSSKAHHTLLAPEDAAFTKLDSKVRDLIFADKKVAADVVKHHLIPDTVCCASVPSVTWLPPMVSCTPWTPSSSPTPSSNRKDGRGRDSGSSEHFHFSTILMCQHLHFCKLLRGLV